ncbi:unnamed protein product [Ambrosiozyma monospora]|uniref:Unnamed protein product n=1 Tax=Ambrosiozyma monospora TaxID=43982 RepID=A0ACB5TB57_AMBMO|nr:unnamed protein product [Ambrosiozyma monospora]
MTPAPPVGQCIFFVFHIIKVLVIYFVMSYGLANPYSVTGQKADLQRDDLVRIGWTGAKKATPLQFQDYYRKYKIQEAGGTMKAYQKGLFNDFKNAVTILGDGEGYQTPVGTATYDTNSKKFKLNYAYIADQEDFFHKLNSSLGDAEFATKYKDYRRYGPMVAPEKLKKLIADRMEFGDGTIADDQELPVKEEDKTAEKK